MFVLKFFIIHSWGGWARRRGDYEKHFQIFHPTRRKHLPTSSLVMAAKKVTQKTRFRHRREFKAKFLYCVNFGTTEIMFSAVALFLLNLMFFSFTAPKKFVVFLLPLSSVILFGVFVSPCRQSEPGKKKSNIEASKNTKATKINFSIFPHCFSTFLLFPPRQLISSNPLPRVFKHAKGL